MKHVDGPAWLAVQSEVGCCCWLAGATHCLAMRLRPTSLTLCSLLLDDDDAALQLLPQLSGQAGAAHLHRWILLRRQWHMPPGRQLQASTQLANVVLAQAGLLHLDMHVTSSPSLQKLCRTTPIAA